MPMDMHPSSGETSSMAQMPQKANSRAMETMSRLSVEEVEEQLQALKVLTRQLGISSDIDAFMTLAFVSLPVIPKLRINTYGVIDVDRQKQVPPSF